MRTAKDGRRKLKSGACTIGVLVPFFFAACSTVPDEKVVGYAMPKNAFIGDPGRPFKSLGVVRAKADYNSLNSKFEEAALCKNFFHKAVGELVKLARKQGADAVIDVKSVVFLYDGRVEVLPPPQCSDEGDEGQALVQGIAVKWLAPGATIGGG